MPKICYTEKRFGRSSRDLIDKANAIINEYSSQGYDLTLRQLYYQFVSRDYIANTMKEYKRLGGVVNDARLAGLIDWDHITDRTRNLHSLSTWGGPEDIVRACADQFRVDRWANQDYRPEVWIEKEALAGVFQRVCDELRVPMFACRGYTSQSEMWAAGQRLKRHLDDGKTPVVFHFGDHDPSGIDMSRDITDRLELFMGGVKFERLALNMDQVREYGPPPNPAKITDSRAAVYIRRFGNESWELDALEPNALAALVRESVGGHRDEERWAESGREESKAKQELRAVSRNWGDAVEAVGA